MKEKIPSFLLEKLKEQYDEKEVQRIRQGYCCERKTTFRVNTLKATVEEIERELKDDHISYQKVDWYSEAFIIEANDEKVLRQLKCYEEGKIYLQSLSAMIPALFLEPQENENILDMTAAPGGKTTQLASLSHNMALITACEKNKMRAERLQYNIQKQGTSRVTVLQEDARQLNDYFSFDKVLLDSPCSGSGTIHLEEEKEIFFTEEWFNRLVKTQQNLLMKAVNVLKSGHEMVYSTCSILKEENEENIQKLLQKHLVELMPLSETITQVVPTLSSTLPNVLTICPTNLYEGFFVAKLRKK